MIKNKHGIKFEETNEELQIMQIEKFEDEIQIRLQQNFQRVKARKKTKRAEKNKDCPNR